MSGKAPSEKEVIEAITELKGKAQLEDLMASFGRKGLRIDRTKTWDRLVTMSRKGILKNEHDIWKLPS